jgi:hypothetical protein
VFPEFNSTTQNARIVVPLTGLAELPKGCSEKYLKFSYVRALASQNHARQRAAALKDIN